MGAGQHRCHPPPSSQAAAKAGREWLFVPSQLSLARASGQSAAFSLAAKPNEPQRGAGKEGETLCRCGPLLTMSKVKAIENTATAAGRGPDVPRGQMQLQAGQPMHASQASCTYSVRGAATNPSDLPPLHFGRPSRSKNGDPLALPADPPGRDHLILPACLRDLSGSPSIQLSKQTQG